MRALADDPAAMLAVLERGIPLAFCDRCEEVSSLSRCPLCGDVGSPLSAEELRFDLEAGEG